MKYLPILPLFIMLPVVTFAETEISPFQLGVGAAFSVLDNDFKKSESVGYELMLGYHLTDMFLLEAGFADYNPTKTEDESINPLISRFKAIVPISDYASLYAGGGVAYDNSKAHPLLNLGVQYNLNDNWYTDVGYQGMFNIGHEQRDLYSFNVSLVYRFSTHDKKIPIVQQPVEKPEISEEPAGDLTAPVVIADAEGCKGEVMEYHIVKGDTLSDISYALGMTVKELIASNRNSAFNPYNFDLIYPGEIIEYSGVTCE